MAFWSANGSTLKIGAATLQTRITRLVKASRNVDNTHSGTSSSNYEHVVGDHSWSAEVPWDDTNLPDTDFGLVEGAKVTLRFDQGASGKFEILTGTLVERLEDVHDNSGDIIRTNISGKGGVLTRAIT